MTAMPEMVALFNGFGGLASLLVGWSEYHLHPDSATFTVVVATRARGTDRRHHLLRQHDRLRETRGKDHRETTAVLRSTNRERALVLAAGRAVWVSVDPTAANPALIVMVVLSFLLGVMACDPDRRRGHAGRDLAPEQLLRPRRLRRRICDSQHRADRRGLPRRRQRHHPHPDHVQGHEPLAGNVLFSGFGAATAKKSEGYKGEAKPISAEDTYFMLEAARSVVIVPGYGMAVAQAQHAVRELGELLIANGCEVRYAIHPVAGRMPGHMNVLLAEANVPYEQLVEPQDVNPIMETVDVAMVVGANDVVNPAARTETTSPLYGMPVVNVDQARTCIVLKRSLKAGFAGVDNPLFFAANTRMLLGDAKESIQALVAGFKGT
jgi:H+-translocating NAD(P) transhydrogenase subunit beta